MLTHPNVRAAFALLGVNDFRSLSRAYGEEDQRLMKTKAWDDSEPSLITNRIKMLLEGINPSDLSESDKIWWHEILWFWYHHATSIAIWKRKDRKLAQLYAGKALELQMPDHPNKITRLLHFLVHEKLKEAELWADQITESPERETAAATLQEYKNGEFF